MFPKFTQWLGPAGELAVEVLGSAAKVQKAGVVELPKEAGMHQLAIPLGAGSRQYRAVSGERFVANARS